MDKRLIQAPPLPGNWDKLRAGFDWPQLDHFNMAEAVVGDWARAEPERKALIQPRASGEARHYTYGEIWRMTGKLANLFVASGLTQGDRVAILLGQGAETLVAHMATYRVGAIAVPLFTLFGESALQYRLENSGARILITDHENLPKVAAIRGELPALTHVFSIDGDDNSASGYGSGNESGNENGARDFWAAMVSSRSAFETALTKPETPALLVYTSGTTGPPKGALHGHQVVLGHLPGVETHHEFMPQPDDCAWTPADWAWMGGLANILLPALYLGVPVVAHRAAKFDPDEAYALIKTHKIRNVFFPPTALKLLRQAPVPKGLNLRSVASGGEALGADLLDWAQDAFGVTVNEFYGSTECNLVLGNCAKIMEVRAGSTGKPIPGKHVAVINADGQPVATGETGEIAVKRGDPAMFLEYWQDPIKTAEKFTGDWMRMGDEGMIDEDGYFFFAARTDDVITSAGYRIGPSEIEDCLSADENVTMAAAIGVPDALKGEVVKAFVVLRDGAALDETGLIARVRARLSPHVAPRSIEAVAALPLTATGKIMRRALKE